ncbi:MAG: TRAP transporter TatT component family protein [Acidobacteriota bacterium]
MAHPANVPRIDWSSSRRFFWVAGVVALGLLVSCSPRKLAVGALADALSESSGVFARDDDPELVGDALPFTLKTLEALLETAPDDVDLLLATCSGFTQYTFAYVDLEAEALPDSAFRERQRLSERALRLYVRARGYCLRALEVRHEGLSDSLVRDPAAALAPTTKDDVPLLFWTAGAWGSAISHALHRPDMVIDLPVVEQLLARALTLDPTWDRGALHEAMMALEALPQTMGGSPAAAEEHYRRAVELADGERAGTHVSYALLLAVPRQDREAFEAALRAAQAVDLDASPPDRLANVLAQRRARLLLDRADEYFLDDGPDPDAEP